VKTRCPICGTVNEVDAQQQAAQDVVRCQNCGNAIVDDTDIELQDIRQNEAFTPDLELSLETEEAPDYATPSELPFSVPEDLPELEPSADAALDIHRSLQPKQRPRTPWWQTLLMLLLLCALILQSAWFTRAHWLHFPEAKPLCEWIDCSIAQKTDVQAFRVIERQLQAAKDTPDALRLQVRFRNDATFAQPLPKLQLSLFDSGGVVLARRSFDASDYLIPVPAANTLAQAQEVFTIELLFEDPGARASGFKIDFL